MELKPALCLDLDGTVRYSKHGSGWVKDADDIALFEGAEAKLWEYRYKGYLIVGITNQGGVADGFRTAKDVGLETSAMLKLFERNPFHHIEACLFKAHGKVEPYCHRSLARKPDYGMLVLAEMALFNAGFIIDWDHSLFVGDRKDDENCAKNARIRFQWAHHFFERDPHVPPLLRCTSHSRDDGISVRCKLEEKHEDRHTDGMMNWD